MTLVQNFNGCVSGCYLDVFFFSGTWRGIWEVLGLVVVAAGVMDTEVLVV